MISKTFCAGLVITAALTLVPAQSSSPHVELSLIVTDKDNKPINTIRKEDLHVFEGKVEQTILSLEADTRPVDLALVEKGEKKPK